MKEFQKYCVPKRNLTVQRSEFNSRSQKEGESILKYITELKTLSATCEFGALTNSLICDRVVCGIKSDYAREKLLSKTDLTLEKDVETLTAIELAKEGSNVIKAETDVNIDFVQNGASGVQSGASGGRYSFQPRARGQQRFRGPGQFRGQGQLRGRAGQFRGSWARGTTTQKYCGKCGFEDHHANVCPAAEKVCHNCGKIGHFRSMCYASREVHAVDMGHEEDQDIVGQLDVDSLQIHEVGSHKLEDWMKIIDVEGLNVEVKLDSGAQANVLSSVQYNKLPDKPPLCKVSEHLVSYDGGVISTIGKATFRVKCNDKLYSTVFYVVSGRGKSILGRADCERFGLIARVGEVSQKSSRYSLDNPKYSELFEGLGCLPGKYKIRVKPEVKPVVHPCRKVPFPLRDKVKT